MDPAASTIPVTSPTNSPSLAGPSQEATASPRVFRMSTSALAAKAYAAKVTALRTPSDASKDDGPSTKDVPNARPLVRPPSRVARARIVFPDSKCTMVREAVMPEGVPAKTYYQLMGKSLVNLKEILNKTFNSKINSPSPVVPRKRRSSVGKTTAFVS